MVRKFAALRQYHSQNVFVVSEWEQSAIRWRKQRSRHRLCLYVSSDDTEVEGSMERCTWYNGSDGSLWICYASWWSEYCFSECFGMVFFNNANPFLSPFVYSFIHIVSFLSLSYYSLYLLFLCAISFNLCSFFHLPLPSLHLLLFSVYCLLYLCFFSSNSFAIITSTYSLHSPHVSSLHFSSVHSSPLFSLYSLPLFVHRPSPSTWYLSIYRSPLPLLPPDVSFSLSIYLYSFHSSLYQTDEAWGISMGGQRWAQLGSHAVVPNAIMPNTFVS